MLLVLLFDPVTLVTDDFSYYFAFSLGTPDSTIRRWQEALDLMKKNGTDASIRSNYLKDLE